MTLETDLNKMTRCMKALNGSVWMDSKLRLEWAHAPFKERLAREASEAVAKAQRAAEEARRDAEGCRRAQAIAAQAPDDEEVEIGDISRL